MRGSSAAETRRAAWEAQRSATESRTVSTEKTNLAVVRTCCHAMPLSLFFQLCAAVSVNHAKRFGKPSVLSPICYVNEAATLCPGQCG